MSDELRLARIRGELFRTKLFRGKLIEQVEQLDTTIKELELIEQDFNIRCGA